LKGKTLVVSSVVQDFSFSCWEFKLVPKKKGSEVHVGLFFFFELFKSSGKGYFFGHVSMDISMDILCLFFSFFFF